MFNRTNIIYRYDGSFDGLLCCVFESYARKETPANIIPDTMPQEILYPIKEIDTVQEQAERVYLSLARRIGPEAQKMVETCFLYGEAGKELTIYGFIRTGLRFGPKAVGMLADDTINRFHRMIRAVGNESHLMLEFLRFSEYDGVLVAEIEPKHYVLPHLQEHFSARFPEEQFVIYDKTHGQAVFYQPYEAKIIPIDCWELPRESEQGIFYRQLWKRYYDSIAIEERYNPRCRMTHMYKRFWSHIHEMEDDRYIPREEGSSKTGMSPLPDYITRRSSKSIDVGAEKRLSVKGS